MIPALPVEGESTINETLNKRQLEPLKTIVALDNYDCTDKMYLAGSNVALSVVGEIVKDSSTGSCIVGKLL